MILSTPLAGAVLSHIAQRDSIMNPAQWTVPDGRKADLGQAFLTGTTVNLQWNGGYNNSISDLWLTSYNYDQSEQYHNFSQRLLTAVDLNESGGYAWDIKIDQDQISRAPDFILRFIAASNVASYNPALNDLASPAFIIASNQSPSPTGDYSTSRPTADPVTGLEISTDGFCGTGSDTTCNSSGLGICCGIDGRCGSNDFSCGWGCQERFGSCQKDTSSYNQDGPTVSTGTIVGAAIGGVAGVVLLGLVAWWIGRRQAARRPAAMTMLEDVAISPVSSFSRFDEEKLASSPTESVGSVEAMSIQRHEVVGSEVGALHIHGKSAPVELDARSIRR